MTSPFLVPASTVRVEVIVTKSRFIATAGLASSVDNAKAFLRCVRAEMPDATHHVYAFRVGFGTSVIEGMSDDGEPAGTSGPPVLAVLRGAGIGDVIVVVTRYFGGTKLGTGGLVRAYSGAAREALAALPVELKIEKRSVGISVRYTYYDRLRLILSAHHAIITDEDFAGDITVFATLPADQIPALEAAVRDLTAGESTPVLLDDPAD